MKRAFIWPNFHCFLVIPFDIAIGCDKIFIRKVWYFLLFLICDLIIMLEIILSSPYYLDEIRFRRDEMWIQNVPSVIGRKWEHAESITLAGNLICRPTTKIFPSVSSATITSLSSSTLYSMSLCGSKTKLGLI